MDLWIRSQDRERLGKIILIEYYKDDYGYYLFGWRDKYEGSRLATYKSKERALEILDEIQKKLKSSFIVNGLGEYISQSNTTIYEMPEV